MDTSRLATLQRYLREDPTNAALLADACDEAIAAGEHAIADALLARAGQLRLDELAWGARRARLALARHAWDEALVQLAALRQRSGPHPALAHDVAFVHLRQGRHEDSRAAVEPWLNDADLDGLDAELRAALQVVWLRASHHLGALHEAHARALQWQGAGRLAPAAAGVTSLVELDLGDFARARLLAEAALAAGATTPEALVTRGCIALAEGDNAAAMGALRRAMELHPEDGRTWSALGMASLQAREPALARTQFARASQLMPAHVGTWHGLGWSCLLLQDRAGALAAFQQALALDRNFAESHAAVGLVLLLSQRLDEAEHHLVRGEKLDAGNATGRYARALQSGQLNDANAVRAFAERLLQRPGLFAQEPRRPAH
jgi:Flp pilus assembly protein TadD